MARRLTPPQGPSIARAVYPPADLRGFLRASKQRTRLVEALASGPKTPTDLAQLTQLPKSNVSRALSALASHGVVYCQTPDLRKGRLYALIPESALQLQVWNRTDELPSKGPVPDVRSGFAPRVRGEAMTAGVLATAEILGAQALIDLCRACGFNFLGFERDGWYSMDLHHLFLRELTGMAEGDRFEVLRRMGRKSVAHLPYMQRFLADRNVDLIALAERTSLAHDHYFNFGRFEVLPSVEGVEIRQFDMLPTPEFCAARSGNFEGILEAKGVRSRVVENACVTAGADHCAFNVRVLGLLARS